jgi:hypothetical protein
MEWIRSRLRIGVLFSTSNDHAQPCLARLLAMIRLYSLQARARAREFTLSCHTSQASSSTFTARDLYITVLTHSLQLLKAEACILSYPAQSCVVICFFAAREVAARSAHDPVSSLPKRVPLVSRCLFTYHDPLCHPFL